MFVGRLLVNSVIDAGVGLATGRLIAPAGRLRVVR